MKAVVLNGTGKVIHKTFDDIQTFDKGKDILLAKNFHLSEFECRCGYCRSTRINGKHIQKLQEFRDKIGRIIHVTSGYRCPNYNYKIGGAQKSQHLTGTATDIVVHDLAPSEVQKLAETFGFDGLGVYKSFTHVDSRGSKARW